MSFQWEITNLVQLDMNHSLKWMQYRLKLVDKDKDEDMVVVVEWISDIMVLIVIIPQFYFILFYKEKSHGTTISGVILRQNKKMRSVYKINLLRTMRIIVIHMIWRHIGCIHVIYPNIWSTFTKHQEKEKEKR